MMSLHHRTMTFASHAPNTSIPTIIIPDLVRWNMKQLKCSMIDYLLHLCPESVVGDGPHIGLILSSSQEICKKLLLINN
jgi:hypothetical protein